MKTIYTFRLYLTILLAGIVFSCSKQAQNNYIRVIPNDALFVFSYDAKSMNAKSEIPVTEKEKLNKTILDNLQNTLSPNLLQQVEKIMKNPQESGLSNEDRIYIFLNPTTSSEKLNGGIVVKVTDLNKLKQNVQLLETEQKCTAPVEKNGYWETSLDNNVKCAYNEELLLLLVGTDEATLSASLTQSMEQKEENSILNNKGFNKLNNQQNDIALYLKAGKITSLLSGLMTAVQQPIPNQVMLEGIASLTSLNFEQGVIRLNTENYAETSEAQQLLEQQAALSGAMKSVFLDCFPASSLVYIGGNIQGEKIYEFLQTYPQKEVQEAFLKAQENQQIDLKKLFSAFQGDISLGFTSLSTQIPVITAYAEMKDNYLMDWFKTKKDSLSKVLGVTFSETGENAYNALIGGSVTIYFGQKGDILYLTNDAQAGQNPGSKVNNPMSEAPWAKNAKNSYGIFVINISDLMKQPLIAMALSMAGNSEEMALLRTALAGCFYIEIHNTSSYKGEMNIVLNNQNENALKQISSGLIQLVEKLQ